MGELGGDPPSALVNTLHEHPEAPGRAVVVQARHAGRAFPLGRDEGEAGDDEADRTLGEARAGLGEAGGAGAVLGRHGQPRGRPDEAVAHLE